MYTQCPLCDTQYHVSAAELKAALGKVRCAQCDSVFNALSHLSDSPPETAAATLPPFTSDSMEGDTDETPVQILTTSMAHSTPMISDAIDTPSRLMMEEFTYPHRKPYRTLNTALWGMSILFLLALLLAQYGYAMRAELARKPELRPMLEQLCAVVQPFAHCEIPLQRNVALIALEGQDVRLHPHFQNTLLASVTLLNKARFAQPYPTIELTLADFNGALVGRRRFQPAEYLPPDVDIGRGMAPQGIATAGLELVTPATPINLDLASWSFTLL